MSEKYSATNRSEGSSHHPAMDGFTKSIISQQKNTQTKDGNSQEAAPKHSKKNKNSNGNIYNNGNVCQ